MTTGRLQKMKVTLDEVIGYQLLLDSPIVMNDLIGKTISLSWNGLILCSNCGKQIKKTYDDGYCYNCFISVPETSECIIRPELCQAHVGGGRNPEWEQMHHNVPHVVYLTANNVIKVGVTRLTQLPTRWIDQGANRAIRLAETPNRYEAGRLEVALKTVFTDKTNWQRMLKNEIDESIDLVDQKWQVHDLLPSDLTRFFSENDELVQLNYPVLEYPQSIKSISLDSMPRISGDLIGIKGQYLIFRGGLVFNVRRHTGYVVELFIP